MENVQFCSFSSLLAKARTLDMFNPSYVYQQYEVLVWAKEEKLRW